MHDNTTPNTAGTDQIEEYKAGPRECWVHSHSQSTVTKASAPHDGGGFYVQLHTQEPLPTELTRLTFHQDEQRANDRVTMLMGLIGGPWKQSGSST